MTAPAIRVEGLTKRYDGVAAVDDLSFEVRAGAVTGFLGPNGAGKTTTLRMVLGLTEPTSGRSEVRGRPFIDHTAPASIVGAALEASGFHPGRRGLDHLRTLAPHVGASDARCREVLGLVGLADAGDKRVGAYSMGMRQRLGLASGLLGDPEILILDEPANGLDPQGIVWLRSFLREFAASGRTVLVSSHVLSEVQSTVDDVVIIAGGRLVHASSLAGLAALADVGVLLRAPDAEALRALASDRGWSLEQADDGRWWLPDRQAAEVGAAAHAAGIELHELTPRSTELEQVFLRLTADDPAAQTSLEADG